MIDTLRSKIDVVRSLGERVSLLRLRNRSYILVENRRDRVSERTDQLIPLPPCFGWQECLAAFHAQALQWRKLNRPKKLGGDPICERIFP